MTAPIARLHAKLPKGWLKQARAEASQRYSSNRAAGVINAKVGNQSNEKTEFLGVCGEMGYSLIWGVQRDETVCPRHGSIDFIMPGGIKTEVKATDYLTGHLLASAKELQESTLPAGHPAIRGAKGGLIGVHQPADHYALILIDGHKEELIYAGYATFAQLINQETVKRMKTGYKESFALPQSVLTLPTLPCMDQLAHAAQERGNEVRIVLDYSRIAYA